MAQTTYQKIEEYVDLAVAKGYSKDYIIEQLDTKKKNLSYNNKNNYNDFKNKIENAAGNLQTPAYLLSDFLKERLHPKPAYLSDFSIHPAVRRYFEALYNLIDDYELYFAPPCNPDEFIAIEKYFEIQLPKAFKDFYLITNGASEIISTFYWYSPAPLNDIIEKSKLGEWDDGFTPEVYFKSPKPMIFTTNDNGSGLWSDFDTSLESGVEIIEVSCDSDARVFIAKSFEELLNNISERMEKMQNVIIYYSDSIPCPYHFEWQIDVYEVLNPTLLEK